MLKIFDFFNILLLKTSFNYQEKFGNSKNQKIKINQTLIRLFKDLKGRKWKIK